MTVLITGHRGLVGSAIILQAPYSRIQQPRTLDGLDLTRKAGVESLFTTKREAPSSSSLPQKTVAFTAGWSRRLEE
ncbi:hypothetical protein ACFX1X_032071 [Malus domestica]